MAVVVTIVIGAATWPGVLLLLLRITVSKVQQVGAVLVPDEQVQPAARPVRRNVDLAACPILGSLSVAMAPAFAIRMRTSTALRMEAATSTTWKRRGRVRTGLVAET